MKTWKLLRKANHRPWPLPDKPWKYYQEWNDVVFLHWQVEADELKKLLPDGLELDLFEGTAWISLVAFTIEGMRPRFLPAFPPVSRFHEVNLRTYVKRKGKAGIYFLNIEAGNRISSSMARMFLGLPYHYSCIHRKATSYQVKNRRYEDNLYAHFSFETARWNTSVLDKWLVERYALLQDTTPGTIDLFEIHHVPWTLERLHLDELKLSYPRFNRLLIGEPQVCHYSKGVQVLTWGKVKSLNKVE